MYDSLYIFSGEYILTVSLYIAGGAHLQSVLRLLSSQDRRIIETIIQDT